MDIYELKNLHLRAHPNSHYFDRDTLKFFGESLSTMRVLKGTVVINDISGEKHTCYMVSKLGKDFQGNKRRSYAYFDVETLEDVNRA